MLTGSALWHCMVPVPRWFQKRIVNRIEAWPSHFNRECCSSAAAPPMVLLMQVIMEQLEGGGGGKKK